MSDELLFAEENEQNAGPNRAVKSWKMLVVDDEPEVHSVTRLALGSFSFEDRPLEFLHAHSGREAIELLGSHDDIALVLLDVVMEEEDAGLKVARHVREGLKNKTVRLVLRTGQPGQAPESRVILEYDINDYKTKTELTAQRLFTTVVSSLRAYRDIVSLNLSRDEQTRAREKQQSALVNELAGDPAIDLRLFCRSSDILCGDAYSLHRTRDGGVLAYVIDGMGHGILPSLTVFAVASSIRRYVGEANSLGELARAFLNAVRPALHDEEQLSYALLWIAPDFGRVDYAVGGMYPPLIQSAAGVQKLSANNTPLMNFTPKIKVDSLPIDGFKQALIYTDGLVEDSAFELAHHEVEALLERATLEKVLTQLEAEELEDDVTVISLIRR
ncbi:MAG: PP2C family protein-serine/threonine phosphatase [Campylobacterales bacterium]